MTEREPGSVPTVCPECAVGCHLERRAAETGSGAAETGSGAAEAGSDPSRARGVAGPANPDGRLCRRGVTAFEVAGGDDDRLTRPQVRRDGELVPVSWTTAYRRVVSGIEAVVDERGPDALAFLGAPRCTNEENYLLQKLARTLGTNNVDNRARLCHAATARALSDRLGWPATTNSLDDLRDADVIVVAGANPAERQPVAFNAFVRPAVDDGATLVHVDPAANRTTRLADVHLAPRPGTDALVFDLLSAHVLAAAGVDREFVSKRTRGYEAFAAGLREYDRDAAASVAGVDGAAVRRVADAIASADGVAVLLGTGVEGSAGGFAPEGESEAGTVHGEGSAAGTAHGEGPAGGASVADAVLDLLLLTGNLGRPGAGVHVLRGLVNEQGATDAGCVPDRLPGHQPVTDPGARARIAAEWGVEPPAEPGQSATALLERFGDGIRGAVVVGANPTISKRERTWLRRRLDALDLLVVAEIRPTRTTRRADVVLPAAAGVEKAGTVTNLDRRVQRIRQTTSPPGAARPDLEILCDLGRRLLDDGRRFDYPSPEAVFDELARVAPTHRGVSYADLGDAGRRWPADGGRVLYRDEFATADGRAQFTAVDDRVQFAAADDRTPSALAPSGTQSGASGGLRLVTGGRAREGDREAADGDRPLRMHPADAGDRDLEPGEAVEISNGEAAVEATVRTDDGVRPGTVALHAAVADPLLRRGPPNVTVESCSSPAADGS